MAGTSRLQGWMSRGLALVAAGLLLAGCGAPGTPGANAAGANAPGAGPDLSVILADRPAERLSDYGLFTDAGARKPASRVLAYDLINPLFSDHAAKHRYVFVPDGTAAQYDPDAAFGFPVGSVLVKTFAFAPDMRSPDIGERFVETRLLVRKADGWAAYPYVWTDDGTEAVYAPVGKRLPVSTLAPDGTPLAFTYAVPNQNQCKTCHAVGGEIVPIGPKARNLNHAGPQGANQLADWTARGLLEGVPGGGPGAAPRQVDVRETEATLEARARAYLEINCAHCHRAGGSASNSGLWLEWDETDPARLGINKYPTAAGRGGGASIHVIVPGDPDRSILAYRMSSNEASIAMPELGRAVVDEDGLALIRAWIAGLDEAGREDG